MYVAPLSFLTCRYLEPQQVDCTLQERIAWRIPVRETRITQAKRASINEELVEGEDDDGNAYSYRTYEVILVGISGETGLIEIGRTKSTAERTAQRINDYLSTPTNESLTIRGPGLWTHTLLTLLGGLVFIFFSFLLMTTLINTVFLFGAWIVEFVLFVVGRVGSRVGLSPEANDRINHFRQVVRGIAIRPEH